jgi:hypothetical protein
MKHVAGFPNSPGTRITVLALSRVEGQAVGHWPKYSVAGVLRRRPLRTKLPDRCPFLGELSGRRIRNRRVPRCRRERCSSLRRLVGLGAGGVTSHPSEFRSSSSLTSHVHLWRCRVGLLSHRTNFKGLANVGPMLRRIVGGSQHRRGTSRPSSGPMQMLQLDLRLLRRHQQSVRRCLEGFRDAGQKHNRHVPLADVPIDHTKQCGDRNLVGRDAVEVTLVSSSSGMAS